MQINMPKDVRYILNKLKDNYYKSYIVGGCIRDSLLNLKPKDWDIATNAKPEEVIEIFKSYKVIPTGIKHGTVTVMINDVGYEITTFRIESDYDEHRRPKDVEFVDDIKEDLARRDFTINAMAYNPEEGLIDPFHGKNDLFLKLIRVVASPGEDLKNRFVEDPLRVLRAYRFAAKYGFCIEQWTLGFGIQKMKIDDFNSLSMERIREEFNKILIYDPRKFIYMDKIFDIILPKFNLMHTNQNNPYHIYNTYVHAFVTVLECHDSLELRLAALLHDIGKYDCKTTDEQGIDHFYGHAQKSAEIAEYFLKRLKYDNKTIDTVVSLIKYHDCELNSKKAIKKMMNKLGLDNFNLLLDLKNADILAQNPKYKKQRLDHLLDVRRISEEIKKNDECLTLKDLAVKGKDLIKLGIKPGPEIGKILNNLLEIVLENPELNEKHILIEIYLKDGI